MPSGELREGCYVERGGPEGVQKAKGEPRGIGMGGWLRGTAIAGNDHRGIFAQRGAEGEDPTTDRRLTVVSAVSMEITRECTVVFNILLF